MASVSAGRARASPISPSGSISTAGLSSLKPYVDVEGSGREMTVMLLDRRIHGHVQGAEFIELR